MNNSRRIGLIMIITGATLWGLSGPMIQWLFQHTTVSSVDFFNNSPIACGNIYFIFLTDKETKHISNLETP